MSLQSFVYHRLYPRAVAGLPVLGTPEAMAAPFRHGDDPLRARAEEMIRAHLTAAASTGFASGLGGWITIPITLPANLVGVALIQLHLAASCAALAGRDLNDSATREAVVRCLLLTDEGDERSAAAETEQRVGVKLAERGLRWGAWKGLKWAGTRRLARYIPLAGGVVGAASDSYLTSVVARHTLDTFFPEEGEG
ncbi:MAG TPA: hypothetical protein VD962_05720 [Rubricoccaceae bacterium]|nr:hypothetical protein [Rubricoccaceae bacterium]